MTVKEMIEKLKEFDGDLELVRPDPVDGSVYVKDVEKRGIVVAVL